MTAPDDFDKRLFLLTKPNGKQAGLYREAYALLVEVLKALRAAQGALARARVGA